MSEPLGYFALGMLFGIWAEVAQSHTLGLRICSILYMAKAIYLFVEGFFA